MRRSPFGPFLLAAVFALLPSTSPGAAANPASGALIGDGTFVPLVTPARPLPREGTAMVYDPVRLRLIAFGGYGDGTSTVVPYNDLWTLSLGLHPVWTPLAASGTPPAPRLAHSMIYDPVRDRLVVFGGGSGAPSDARNDVWALSLSGTPTWTQLAPLGAGPGKRLGHSAIYDPLRDRMIVFGGYDGSAYHNDTWSLTFAFGTPSWSPVAVSTPAGLRARDFAGAVYDPNQDRLVICGGNEVPPSGPGADATDETWAMNLSGAPIWTLLPVTGLGARLGPATAYDALQHRLLVFGGYGGGRYLADSYSLDLAGSPSAWQPLAPGFTPPTPRTFTSAAFDPGLDRFIVFSGATEGRYCSDVDLLDLGGGGWSVVDWPASRSGHTFTFDANGRRGILFGGSAPGVVFNDAWVFDLASQSWTELLPAGTPPPPRTGHVAVLDDTNDRLVVWGGLNGSGTQSDAWALSLGGGTSAWTRLSDSGARPSGLTGASATYDPAHHRMVVVGGQATGFITNGVWTLQLDGDPVWTAWPPSGATPLARSAAGLALDLRRGRCFWFGGLSGAFAPLDDTWQLVLNPSFGTADWTALPAALPRGLWGQAVSVDTGRERVVAIGGKSIVSDDDQVFALPLDLGTGWSELFPTGTPPSARHLSAALYDPRGNRAALVSGTPSVGPDADLWFLDFPEIPTPVLTTLVDATVDGGRVHLTWSTPDGAGATALAERTADGTSWVPLGSLVASGSGLFVLDDAPSSDGRWGYRLRVGPAGTATEITWLTTSAAASLALFGATPNPAVTASHVGFSLRGSLPASLAVYDVAGRVVLARDLSQLGPGRHTLALARGELGGAGVYFVRLREGERTLTRKLALLP